MSATVKTAHTRTIGAESDFTLCTLSPIDPTGVEISEEAILSPYGLDPSCTQSSLLYTGVISSGEPLLKLSLTFDKKWDGADKFVKEMREKFGVSVQQEPHPWKPQASVMYVHSSASDVMTYGTILRDWKENEQLEIDTVTRPLIHPAIIGQLLDNVGRHIREAGEKVNPAVSFAYGAYIYNWAS